MIHVGEIFLLEYRRWLGMGLLGRGLGLNTKKLIR